VAIEDLDFTLT
jgi:hypothetical protein